MVNHETQRFQQYLLKRCKKYRLFYSSSSSSNVDNVEKCFLGKLKKINPLITIGYILLEKTCNVDNLFTLNNYSKNGICDKRIIYYLYGFHTKTAYVVESY